MAGMSVDGLVSGLDTTSLITSLLQIEAQPQTQLKTRLTATQNTAAAYRSINTKFDALRTAAEALTSAGLAAARTATSSSADVTSSATSAAVDGSSTSFSVTALARATTLTSHLEWNSATAVVTSPTAGGGDIGWPLEVRKPDGTADGALVGTIALPDPPTLRNAAAAINASGYGIKATVLQLDADSFRLQVTSTSTGAASEFWLRGTSETTATAGSAFVAELGTDAELTFGNGLQAHSATNTFSDLMTGVSVTVSKADPTSTTTVSVGSDPASVATKVQALVDAANAALGEITRYTASSSTSKNLLTGDSAMADLTSRVLKAVSTAVGDDGSAVRRGLQLTRDGKIIFDRAKFTSTLTSDPALVQRMVGGTPASTAPDGTAVPAVAGLADRLLSLAKSATNSTTGTVTMLAKGRDALAKDIQTRIDDWDLRLAARKATLSRQFTAMESALSSLKSQSSWLSGQLSSLSS